MTEQREERREIKLKRCQQVPSFVFHVTFVLTTEKAIKELCVNKDIKCFIFQKLYFNCCCFVVDLKYTAQITFQERIIASRISQQTASNCQLLQYLQRATSFEIVTFSGSSIAQGQKDLDISANKGEPLCAIFPLEFLCQVFVVHASQFRFFPGEILHPPTSFQRN